MLESRLQGSQVYVVGDWQKISLLWFVVGNLLPICCECRPDGTFPVGMHGPDCPPVADLFLSTGFTQQNSIPS